MIGCSRSTTMSRAITCGSASVSSYVSTGPPGTPALSQISTHSEVVRVVVILSISRSSSSMCAIRSGSVSKRESVSHSGHCTTSLQNRCHSRSLLAPIGTLPKHLRGQDRVQGRGPCRDVVDRDADLGGLAVGLTGHAKQAAHTLGHD